MIKTCIKCGFIGDDVKFSKGENVCKKCKAEWHKQYCENNKERIAERDKQYYENNKKEISERRKQVYKNKSKLGSIKNDLRNNV